MGWYFYLLIYFVGFLIGLMVTYLGGIGDTDKKKASMSVFWLFWLIAGFIHLGIWSFKEMKYFIKHS